MTLLTAKDLTANPSLLPSALPSEKARWRSGYAEDCKAAANARKSDTVSDVAASFGAPSFEEENARLLTDLARVRAVFQLRAITAVLTAGGR